APQNTAPLWANRSLFVRRWRECLSLRLSGTIDTHSVTLQKSAPRPVCARSRDCGTAAVRLIAGGANFLPLPTRTSAVENKSAARTNPCGAGVGLVLGVNFA